MRESQGDGFIKRDYGKGGEVAFVRAEKFVGADLVPDGSVRCVVLCDSGDPVFHEAAIAHCSDDADIGSVSLHLEFQLAEIVDSCISLYATKPPLVSEEARPICAAMRRELVAMIAKIDAVQFEGASQ